MPFDFFFQLLKNIHGFIKYTDNEKYKNLTKVFFSHIKSKVLTITDCSNTRLHVLARPKRLLLLTNIYQVVSQGYLSSYTDLDLEVCFIQFELVGCIES